MNNNNSISRTFRYFLSLLLSSYLLPIYAVPLTSIKDTVSQIKTTNKLDNEMVKNETVTIETISIKGKVSLASKNLAQDNEDDGDNDDDNKAGSEIEIEDTIIYFEPNQKVFVKPLTEPHQIRMIKKAYHPRVSAITVGSEIQIPNNDTIIHNAFSPSKPNDFDMGFYGKSEGKIHRISQTGVIRIFCNVHFHMVAYVLALDTPYFTHPDKNGLYSLDNLPQGGGQLVFWHERTEQVIKKITLPQNQHVDTQLEVNKRRVPKHKNKSGRSYKNNKRSRRSYN